MNEKKNHPEAKDSNRDPISGQPGAHPVGVGVGTAVGGGAAGAALGAVGSTAAAGAALGTAAGPVGAVVGAVAGGVVGGLVGKQVAETINPTAEDAYWKEHYQSRPYVEKGASYDEYRPAYQYGWESRSQYAGKHFADVENDLHTGWDKMKAKSRLNWDKAKNAVRDAWERTTGSTRSTPTAGQTTPTTVRTNEEIPGQSRTRSGP